MYIQKAKGQDRFGALKFVTKNPRFPFLFPVQ